MWRANLQIAIRGWRTASEKMASLSTSTVIAAKESTSSYLVIGNGPIGASVAKHLVGFFSENRCSSDTDSTNSKQQRSCDNNPIVTIIDGRLSGMGSSHADRARLIRAFDAEGDIDWTRWNKRSLKAFPEIERLWNKPTFNGDNLDEYRSTFLHNRHEKKQFFAKCGGLLVGDKQFVERSMRAALVQSTPSSTEPLRRMSPHHCCQKWPFLKPKAGCDEAVFDPSGGIIDPLAFVRAQNYVTEHLHDHRCLQVRQGIATAVRGGGEVELASGETLKASKKVIVCGGAFSKSLLTSSGILGESSSGDGIDRVGRLSLRERLRASKRTVALLEVTPDVAQGILSDMPTIKYAFGLEGNEDDVGNDGGIGRSYSSGITTIAHDQNKVEAGSVYVLPPVVYPEKGGGWFVKIGGGPNDFFANDSQNEEIQEWLSSGGDPDCVAWLEDHLRSLLPEVPLGAAHGMACVTTVESPTGFAGTGVVVEDSFDESLVLVSACQGKGAGPADAVGWEIARRIVSPSSSKD